MMSYSEPVGFRHPAARHTGFLMFHGSLIAEHLNEHQTRTRLRTKAQAIAGAGSATSERMNVRQDFIDILRSSADERRALFFAAAPDLETRAEE